MTRVALCLLLAFALTACGGSDSAPDGGDDSDVQVVALNPIAPDVPAGSTVTFTSTVLNVGPAAAREVTITHHLDGAPAVSLIVCTPAGGAVCPTAVGETMAIDSLPVGGALVFNITVPIPVDSVGPVTSTVIATAADDPDTANNRDDSSTVSLDLRNGDYDVFASNGRVYRLSVNFNTMGYRMVGANVDSAGMLARDADGLSYIFGGNARFRTAPDMVVGGFAFNVAGSTHPYDTGVRPFVAARRFATSLDAVAGGSYNLLGLNLRRNNNVQPAVLPATFGADTLQLCQGPAPVRVEQCPDAFLNTYALTLADGVFTGTDAAQGDLIHFRVALSGDARIVLRAEEASDETGRHFRVGLVETPGLAGGSFATSSTRGAWGLSSLSDTAYSYSGTDAAGVAFTESATLTELNTLAPTGLRRGLRAGDMAPLNVAQHGHLSVMLGEEGGGAAGLLDIGAN